MLPLTDGSKRLSCTTLSWNMYQEKVSVQMVYLDEQANLGMNSIATQKKTRILFNLWNSLNIKEMRNLMS